MFELARGYGEEGHARHVRHQDAGFGAGRAGTPPPATSARWAPATSTVTSAITPDAATVALAGSTESQQFAGTH
jgi:isocitrate lyase